MKKQTKIILIVISAFVLLILILATIAIASRIGKSIVRQQANQSQTSQAANTTPVPNACEVIPAARISSIIGTNVTVDATQTTEGGKADVSTTTSQSDCTFVAGGDSLVNVSIRMHGPGTMASDKNYAKSNYDETKKSVSSQGLAKEVSNLGDDAYFSSAGTGNSGNLYVLKKDSYFSVILTGVSDNTAHDEQSVAIAREIVSKI